MRPTMTTGGRGMTRERARAAAEAGMFAVSVSIDGERETHDRLRGVKGSYDAALAALDHLRDAGIHVATNTQINRLTMPELPRMVDRLGDMQVRSWQIQLTVAMGRAVDEPDVLLQPYDILELHPMLAELVPAAKARGIDVVAGNNVGYFGPHETALRGRTRAGYSGGCGAGRVSNRDRGGRHDQGVPEPRYEELVGRQRPRDAAEGHLGALDGAPLHARSHGEGALGVLRDLLLRRGVQGGLHVDGRRPLREAGQQPVLPSSRPRDEEERPPGARRPRGGGARPAVRSGQVRARDRAAAVIDRPVEEELRPSVLLACERPGSTRRCPRCSAS